MYYRNENLVRQRAGPVPFRLLHRDILTHQMKRISKEVDLSELEKR